MIGRKLQLGVLAVACIFTVGMWAMIFAEADTPQIDPTRIAPAPATSDDEGGGSMLVVGDSWTAGGPMNNGPTWPYLMDTPDGWTVYADALGGSGYIGDAANLGIKSDGRLNRLLRENPPDVVVVAMGRNDIQHDPGKVIATARDTFEKMKLRWPDSEVVAFSPFSPEPPTPETAELTRRLRQLSSALDIGFVDVSQAIGDRPRLIKDAHPNDAGQRAVAAQVGPKLADLGVFAQ